MRRATPRRKRSQRGNEIMEFALTLALFMPMFLGAIVIGMNLIRSTQAHQVCRDLTSLYIHGTDFSTWGAQRLAQRLARGLDLQIGSSYSGNSNGNTNNSGKGLITVTKVMWIGATSGATCQSISPSTCTNANSFVYLQQIQFGNGSLANTQTVTLGAPPTGAVRTSSGYVQAYITDADAKLGTTAHSIMQGLWQVSGNGRTPLQDGQVVYIVETYFQTPDMNFGSVGGGSGVYSRYFY